MKERIIGRDQYRPSKWQGGETTELFIWPEKAIFPERDFLFRISSATFTGTGSAFSNFSGYQRYILPLEGQLTLTHQGLYSRELKDHEPEYFDGSWSTLSENSPDCRDYNFIVRNGSRALLQILDKNSVFNVNEKGIITAFSLKPFQIRTDGRTEKEIPEEALFVVETDEGMTLEILESEAPVLLTAFWI